VVFAELVGCFFFDEALLVSARLAVPASTAMRIKIPGLNLTPNFIPFNPHYSDAKNYSRAAKNRAGTGIMSDSFLQCQP
jgi:hypothetical protein